MSDILSRVQILLDANTARFEQKMENAQDTSKTTFEKISDGAKMMGAAVAAGALTGMTALVSYTDKHIKTITELERFAYLSDTTFEDFQRQAVGAQAAGLEVEQLSDIYKDFNEKLGEVSTVAGGGAVDFLEQVAIKTEGSAEAAMKLMKHMADLSGPEAMELYVKKMEEANLSQEQMSFLMESMASDTTALIPLLVNGAEGMHLWADAAEKAGVIINDETREAAKALSVEIKLLNMQLEGAKNQVMQAVLPAFVDIASAFLTTEGNTISLNGAADGLANTLRFLSKVGLGVVSVFDIVGTIIGGSVAAMASANVSAEDIILDLEAKIDGYGKKFEKIGGSGVSEADKKRLTEIEQERLKLQNQVTKSRQVDTDATKEWLEKQNEATNATKKQASASKSQKDAQDALNKALAEAKTLLYDYGTEFARIDHDLTNELGVIQKSILKPSDKNMMIADAKSISEARKQIYLLEYEADLDSWKWTEESKLVKTLELEIAKITATKGMRQDERNLRIQSQKDIHAHEMAWLQLESAQRLDDAQKAFHTEMQIMTSYYEFERAQIRLNKSLSEEDREVFINASIKTQDLDVDEQRRSAWNNFQNASGFDTSADDERERRNQAFQDALDWQLITQDEYQQQMLRSEAIYNQTRMDMALDVTGSTVSTWADAFGAILGEQSTAYKAMIIADRAIAITRALLNVPEAYSEAFNAVVGTPYIGPYIAPVIGGAAAAAQIAQVALVKGVDVQGIFHGGEDYVPKEASYFLDEGERVLSPRQNTDLTNYLDNQNSRGSDMPNLTINIMTLPGTTAKAEMNANGELNIEMIRKEMDEYIPYQLSKANSPISQAFSVNYATQRNR